jgi:Zn-dependent peptidase ImmA (M78 family)/transcriptional regulator with XRE-family HTH domain
MKVGTPGFIPERLVAAREARALTINSLAEMVNITRQSLSAYESGKQSPSADVLDRLASRLNVPIRYFTIQPTFDAKYKYSYRSLAAATKRARTKAERRFEWFLEAFAWIDAIIELPSPDIPDFGIKDPLSLSPDQVEEFALRTREYWGLGNGPIGHMVALLESRGIVVTRFPLDSEHLDSFSAHSLDLPPFVVLNAEKGSAARTRLDAAHELGHLVLHRGHSFGAVDHKRAEEQAFRFGAAFLFPEVSFLREVVVASLSSFAVLKRRWNVSIAMMINRAFDLELITRDNAERLWRYYASKGYRRHGEPGDDIVPIEEPSLLRRAFEMTFDEGFATKEMCLEAVSLSPAEIEELVCLTPGTLAVLPTVAELRPRQNSLFGTADRPNPVARVVQFPSKRD